jgi:hypothetical protein
MQIYMKRRLIIGTHILTSQPPQDYLKFVVG